MSDFAFFRFVSNGMLTRDEEQHKEEIVRLTEDVLHAKGLQCDASISKLSNEQLDEILQKVRELRKKRKKKGITKDEVVDEQQYETNDRSYIR